MTLGTAPNLQPASHAAPGRRVLVAEDSPTTQEIRKLLLTQRGHHVDIATDGAQALETLRHYHYDVAPLDFHLPKMDGLRVATTVRSELLAHARPRLIAITADLQRLLANTEDCENFDPVIPKPLPKESQNTFKPSNRNQFAKIKRTPSAFPLHQKVSVSHYSNLLGELFKARSHGLGPS